MYIFFKMYFYSCVENISVFFFKLLNYMLGFWMFRKSVIISLSSPITSKKRDDTRVAKLRLCSVIGLSKKPLEFKFPVEIRGKELTLLKPISWSTLIITREKIGLSIRLERKGDLLNFFLPIIFCVPLRRNTDAPLTLCLCESNRRQTHCSCYLSCKTLVRCMEC